MEEGQAALSSVEWTVTLVGPSPPATAQTVVFEPDGGLVVSSGCADYTSTYSIDGDALAVEPPRREFGSLSDCTFGESGSADTFMNLMENAVSWTIDDQGRLIIEAGGRYEGWTITLEPGATAELDDAASAFDPASEDVAGTWRLETMDLGPAGRAAMPAEIEITLSLEPDGALSGFGSCSRYAGGYTTIEHGVIVIEDVRPDETARCDPSLTDLQQLYLAILPVVDRVRVEGDSLVLRATAISAELTYQLAE